MTLTPEQIAQGWRLHDGIVCPIKDARTVLEVKWSNGKSEVSSEWDNVHYWTVDPPLYIIAYRIIEAHGADAAPARPTPFPASYDDLVFDPVTGWSQTFVVDGKRPEWLRDDDRCSFYTDAEEGWTGNLWDGKKVAIRVRRRKPKRETVECCLQTHRDGLFIKSCHGTIDLIDGKPDLSTLKIAEDAL